MNVIRTLLGIGLLVFLVANVSAETSINIYLDSNGDALFLGQTDEVSLTLPEGITISNEEITGITSQVTSKEGETWRIHFSLDNSDLLVVFPPGTKILSLDSGEISIENNRISVFAQNLLNISYTLENTDSGQSLIPLIFIILIAVAIISIAFLVNYKKREKRIEKTKMLKNKKTKKPSKERKIQDKISLLEQVLSEREKLILENLKKTGKTKSSYLRKQCDIPKASFSRHVQELEKKGLIKRTGEGRNKFIELVEN